MKNEAVPNGPFIESALRKASDELNALARWRWLKRRHLLAARMALLDNFRLAILKRDGGGEAYEAPTPVFEGPDVTE